MSLVRSGETGSWVHCLHQEHIDYYAGENKNDDVQRGEPCQRGVAPIARVSAADVGVLPIVRVLRDKPSFHAATVAPIIRVLSLASK